MKTGAYLFIVGIFLAASVHAENATKIIRYGERQLRGLSSQALMTMTVTRPEFTRRLQIRSWAVGGHKALVEILDPPKEEGISSLRVTNQMWNYLPNTDQIVRVPTSLMLQPWMGSDFTNDDLMRASSLARDYHHRIVKTARLGKEKTYLIECRPKPGAPVVWGKVFYWARLKDKLPVKEAYYDEEGALVRTIHFKKFRRMDGRIVPTEVTVSKAQSPGEKTVVRYLRILYDRTIDPTIFNRDKLRTVANEGRELSRGWSLTQARSNHRRGI